MPPSNSPDKRIKILDDLFRGDFDSNRLSKEELKKHNIHENSYTKLELARIVSDVLAINKVLSTKTISNDLKKMEEEYNAPLEEKYLLLPSEKLDRDTNTKVFFYWDKSRSVFSNNNLSKDDLEKLRGVVSILKQLKGFKYFEQVDSLIDKIEPRTKRVEIPEIYLDKVDEYVGINLIDDIAKAVKDNKVLKINYKAYTDDETLSRTIHPYQLREYNNRWFVLAYTEEYSDANPIGVYALDRIVGLPKPVGNKFNSSEKRNVKRYFTDIIGVTNYIDRDVEEIVFEVRKGRDEYVKSKKWHPSQKIKRRSNFGTVFCIDVKQNNELDAMILDFGKDIKVLSPQTLVDSIKGKLEEAVSLYEK
jgi:predicted DNA-binding transcriptional regulator YafY